MSGSKEFKEEIKLCTDIINSNDQYHSFYARQNMMVIYFLTKDNRFWENIRDFSMPYLLKYYEPILFEKIKFFRENFDNNWNINQITEKLETHLKHNGFSNISHFNSLPVLFGLIERWFE